MKKSNNTTTRTTLEKATWKGSQDVNYREFATLESEFLGVPQKKFKIKIEIKRDSYEDQSRCSLSVWHMETLEWKTVYSIPGRLMKTDKGAMYGVANQPISESIFSQDIATLLNGTKSILF